MLELKPTSLSAVDWVFWPLLLLALGWCAWRGGISLGSRISQRSYEVRVVVLLLADIALFVVPVAALVLYYEAALTIGFALVFPLLLGLQFGAALEQYTYVPSTKAGRFLYMSSALAVVVAGAAVYTMADLVCGQVSRVKVFLPAVVVGAELVFILLQEWMTALYFVGTKHGGVMMDLKRKYLAYC